MRRFLGVMVLLAACSKSSTSGGDDHWSKRPLETMSGTVSGVDFTIQVPKGMRITPRGDEVEFDLHEHGRAYTPDLSVRSWPHPGTLDGYLATVPPGDHVRAETVGNGYVVSTENPDYPGKQDYLVHAEKAFGDQALTCDARVTPFRKGDDVKGTLLPLVEAMCLSIEAAAPK
jgi:hypothetical protein